MKRIALLFALFTTACTTTTSAPQTPAASGHVASEGTGVFVNGQELTADDKAQFDNLVGESVPAGRYAIDAQGNLGYEGQAPVINLAELVRARQQQQQRQESGGSKEPFQMYSRDSAGQGSSIVSEGGCTILSTPSGSLSSGC